MQNDHVSQLGQLMLDQFGAGDEINTSAATEHARAIGSTVVPVMDELADLQVSEGADLLVALKEAAVGYAQRSVGIKQWLDEEPGADALSAVGHLRDGKIALDRANDAVKELHAAGRIACDGLY